MIKIVNNFKKKQIRSKNWLEIWEKKGHNLKNSKIEKVIEADGFSSALGTFNKQDWFRYIKTIFSKIELKKKGKICILRVW